MIHTITISRRIRFSSGLGGETASLFSLDTGGAAVPSDSLTPTLAIEVELGGAGLGWTDITEDASFDAGLEITHGISGSGPLDRVAETGTAMFSLLNSTRNSGGVLGYYSPRHVNRRSGWGLGIGCRVRITDPATTVAHTVFLGRIDDIDPAPGIHLERRVAVTAVDWMDEAAKWSLTPAVGEQVGQDWQTIITAILAQMPTQPPGGVILGPGSEVYPYALDTSADHKVLREFAKLAASEFGFIYVKADGTLRAEDRHWRMTSVSPNWLLTEAEYQDLDFPSSRGDVLNTIRVTTHPKLVDPVANQVLYRQANVIPFLPGQTKTLMGPYRDPDTGDPVGGAEAEPLAPGQDYTAHLSPSGGTDLTASFTMTPDFGPSGHATEVTNTAATVAWLTKLEVRGKRVRDFGTTTHEATDATSKADHGENILDFDMPYQANQEVGEAVADYVLAKDKEPKSRARTLTIVPLTSANLTQVLTREISDRIRTSETVTGMSDDFFIQGRTLRLLPSGHLEAEYTLTAVDDPLGAIYFTLDLSVLDGTDVLAPF